VESSNGFSNEYFSILNRTVDKVEEPAKGRYFPVPKRGVSEHLVQLVWKNILYNNGSMTTTDGIPIKILKPGRLNRREGPDFKNGVLLLNGEKVAGDVEIHVEAREWYDHKHHLSPHYKRTILHVFLNRTEDARPSVTVNGKSPHELELGLYLRHSIDELQREVELGDTPLSGRAQNPPCRRYFSETPTGKIERLMDVIGEGRMLIKSNLLFERLEASDPEQVLYETVFEALGYSRFKKQFGHMAKAMPLKRLKEIIKANSGIEPALTVQGVFFRLAGLDMEIETDRADVALQEFLRVYADVKAEGVEPIYDAGEWSIAGSRPANSPFRRIAAFSRLVVEPLDPAMLEKQFSSITAGREKIKEARKTITEVMEIFCRISDPFWDYRYSLGSRARGGKKLVGRDRAVAILVDSLIPLFLAISRSRHDIELEKKLVSAIYAAPKPSSNSVVDFMSRNLFGKERGGIVRSALHQQALIQLYNDFCFSFPSHCGSCPMPDYLSKNMKRG